MFDVLSERRIQVLGGAGVKVTLLLAALFFTIHSVSIASAQSDVWPFSFTELDLKLEPLVPKCGCDLPRNQPTCSLAWCAVNYRYGATECFYNAKTKECEVRETGEIIQKTEYFPKWNYQCGADESPSVFPKRIGNCENLGTSTSPSCKPWAPDAFEEMEPIGPTKTAVRGRDGWAMRIPNACGDDCAGTCTYNLSTPLFGCDPIAPGLPGKATVSCYLNQEI